MGARSESRPDTALLLDQKNMSSPSKQVILSVHDNLLEISDEGKAVERDKGEDVIETRTDNGVI